MTTLYGIKNCDTVKKARKWLEANNIAYQFHDFRADGLSADKVEDWISKCDFSVLVNKRGTTYRQLTDEVKATLAPDNATQMLVESPTLLKRPILELGTDVVIGFKEQDYQQRFK